MIPTAPRAPALKTVRCAIYTRKSTDEGLDQEFNSLDAQREAAQAYIASQQHAGWSLVPDRYDDGGYTGGNMDRPALAQLLRDMAAGREIESSVAHPDQNLQRAPGRSDILTSVGRGLSPDLSDYCRGSHSSFSSSFSILRL